MANKINKEEGTQKTRKSVHWVRAAFNAKETINDHTYQEAKDILDMCTEMMDLANQRLEALKSERIAALKAELEELEGSN